MTSNMPSATAAIHVAAAPSTPTRFAVRRPRRMNQQNHHQQQQQHRILLYTTCYNVLDGVTLTIRKLEQEILAAGHSVCILTTHSGDPANTHASAYGGHQHANNRRKVVFLDNAFCIPFLHDPAKPQLSYQIGFGLSPTVLQQLQDFEPTLVHITTTDITSMHVIQYARDQEIPLMGTYHSNIPDYMEHYAGLSWLRPILAHFFRHQYNFLQSLCVPTPYIQRNLVSNYQMDQVTSLKIWGRGVDVQQFHPQQRSLEYRQSLGIANEEVVVLWVGRLVPEKRTDIFCQTVQRLAAQNVPFKALVVGDGPCEDQAKALPHTIFCGWQDVEQLAVTYASADVFLFPSSVETFGNVTLEAMASGLPVVVESKCSGHLVQDGENGFCCRAGDVTAFFRQTLQLVTDHDLRRRMSATSRRMSLALEKRKIVRKMLDYYDCVTDEFYKEYGGRHAHRDAVYEKKPHSFSAGKKPRPLLFIGVEYLFTFLFGVMWRVMDSFVAMQERLLGFSTSVYHQPSSAAAAAAASISSAKESQQSLTQETTLVHNKKPSIVDLTSSDLASGSGSSSNLLGDDFERNPPQSTRSSTSTSPSTNSSLDQSYGEYSVEDDENDDGIDDDTRSTVSSTNSETESSPSSSARGRDTWRSFSLKDVTNALAMASVRSIFFFCRWETYAREFCSRCRPPTLLHQRRKRKDSDAIVDDEVTKLSIPQARSADVAVVTPRTAQTPTACGHRQRRNHNTSTLNV